MALSAPPGQSMTFGMDVDTGSTCHSYIHDNNLRTDAVRVEEFVLLQLSLCAARRRKDLCSRYRRCQLALSDSPNGEYCGRHSGLWHSKHARCSTDL